MITHRTRSRRSTVRRIALCAVATPILLGVATPPASAAGPTVVGAGSTWSAVAIEQWRSDVARLGLSINYSAVGSTAGRQFYINDQVDFAVSEIPFLPEEVQALKRDGKSFQYLPIVAGGTSMMYNLRNASGQIRNLQMSSATIAKIFTGQITKWNDPAIRADNPHLALPDTTITPVTRSDGSGTSAQFSAYIDAMQHPIWQRFCRATGLSPCKSTSFWPPFGLSVQQRGSDGVANYVANPGVGVGSIGYVETAYALARHMPVVSVLNASRHYVQPTAANVAIALTHATLNADRTQNLGRVYVAPEATAYPISSYSYMITQLKGFDPAKGEVLGKFILYFVCTGQQSAERLGYSPLPTNLVQTSFDAERAIPGAPSPPPMSKCDNPYVQGTFDRQGDPGTDAGTTTTTQTGDPSQDGGGAAGTEKASSGPGTTLSTGSAVPSSADPVAYAAAAAQVAAGARAPSALPLAVTAVVILLLVFAPLFLRLSSPRSDRGPEGGGR